MLAPVSLFESLGLEPTLWTVSQLNRYVRQRLEADYRLQDLWVAGEIASLSRPPSGHLYFTLRDDSASLRCVMWRRAAARLEVALQEGQAVEAHGHVSLYEVGGQYQFYVDTLRPAGEGRLFRQFLRLKARLEAEGLFDPERKQPLPAWPRRIGVVTSPGAAALRDVVHVLRRRFPLAELVLSPTPVQGEAAPPAIVEALQRLDAHGNVDVILLVRGGGSVEDLWAFNTEQVVRAVADCQTPLVTGIGHETDLILADFAADMRAPTPSAAAEMATPDGDELRLALREQQIHLTRRMQGLLVERRASLRELRARLARLSPRRRVEDARQQLDELQQRADAALLHALAIRRAGVQGLARTLGVVSPLAVLDRGYALVTRDRDGVLVRSVTQVQAGDGLHIRVSDGQFPAVAGTPEGHRERREAQDGGG